MYRKILFILVLLYASLNAQWVQTNGPYEASVCSFAVSDSIIFAGTVGAGIYRSTDKGESWTSCNGDMTSVYALSLAVSGKYLYAGSGTGEGISRSTDNGTTWETVNNGLPSNPWANGDNQIVTGVIDRLAASGSNVFTSMRLSPEEFYISTDNGSNWIDANTGTLSDIAAISVIGNNFFVGSNNGVYLSTNNGAKWMSAGLADSAITSLAVNSTGANSTNLFASTNSNVFLSTDNGNTWAPADSGLPQNGINQLSVNGGSVMVKVSNTNIFLSTNSGTNWTVLNITGFLPRYTPIAFTPAGTSLFYGFIDLGIFRSNDKGKSWTVSNTGLQEVTIDQLATTPTTAFISTNNYMYINSDGTDWIPTLTGDRVLAAMDSVIYITADSGICYSTDDGKNWTVPLNTGAPVGFQYTALAAGGNNIYLGGAGICGVCDQGGVYLSTNRGASWIYRGLKNIFSLTVNGTNVYSFSRGGFLYSIDMGSSWNSLSTPQGGIISIAFRGSDMFAGFIDTYNGSSWGGVLHSTDGGKQWGYIDSGLPGISQWVTCLAVQGTHVFVGTTTGVYFLNNNDTSWTAVNTGLPSSSDHVYSLAATNSNLYAALSGTVWKRPLSEMITGVKDRQNNLPISFSLQQNYPNPFNPSTTISYSVPQTTSVTIKVFDILGREITTLVNEEKTAGNYTVQFAVGSKQLASGIYFYRMQAGDFVQTRKLLLLK